MPARKPEPAPPVAYTSALSHASADKRIDILRAVGASGSISQAARDAGVSYKAAWQAIDTLTNLAGVALVQRLVGGAGGGGARLTAAGQQLLDAAAQMAQARSQVLGRLQAANTVPHGGPARVPALGQLAIRTSMRNQLPCVVESVKVAGALARVQLRVANGAVLAARITRASAELLALAPGQGVVALCKATAVTVQAAPGGARRGGANVLQGRATRVARGAEGDEVSVALGRQDAAGHAGQAGEESQGLALVGFAAPGSGLRARSAVALAVDESALVLALPG